MRVLQIASLYPPKMLGGAEVSARNLSDLLVSAGHEVMVVSPDQFRSLPCPTYPEIRLAMIQKAAEAIAPKKK